LLSRLLRKTVAMDSYIDAATCVSPLLVLLTDNKGGEREREEGWREEHGD